ncbi:putative transcriptional regulator, AraC family [Devosia sp. LC5]|uniref:DJ-1/PfpI family protein n=1 Tax=Devosia sp. LC5 TaxID=1502724 RepID=UPI0004E412D2|nr:DJ-1/PfpI family protein [Devosia sp. LC5]KFC64531.1 putative transcriptional regulator, AraC family [Devosia sp. LC5]
MKKRTVIASVLVGAVILATGGFGLWLAALPSGVAAPPEPVPASEEATMLEALRPPIGQRPLVAIVGINDGTETTDYLVPTGILRRAGVADVVMVAAEPGPVLLYPALKVEPDTTLSVFDASHPEGADYVIVPAMSRDDDPAVMAWLQQQSAKGAIVIGVCAGAKVVGAAGLLDGKRATTHWYYLKDLLRRSPTIDYVANRRFVVDGNVVTTTGITASMPMMLTLIEAIAGREKAEAVARDLGVDRWDARHASAAFTLIRPFATTVLANIMAFWNRDEFAIGLEPGMDEVSLALVADAWSRTYRSKAVTFAETSAIDTANGIRILPDRTAGDWPDHRAVSIFPEHPPAAALDQVLQAITERYGESTTNVVAMQLEYPRSNAER